MQVASLHVQVEGPLAAAGLDAGNPFHLGGGLQVLEVLGFVDEYVIDAEFVEHQAVILLVLGEQLFQPLLAAGLLLLDRLDQIRVAHESRRHCALSRSNWSYSSICSLQELFLVVRDMPIRSKELCVTMMPSQSPLAILAVRSLRRSRVRSSLPATSSLALG